MSIVRQAERRNGILERLSQSDADLLESHSELSDLSLSEVLAGPGLPIDYAYFPLSGLVSVVVKKGDGSFVSVGMYGREGAGPTAVMLGQDRTTDLHLVQAAGQAIRILRLSLLDAMARSVTLRHLMVCYVDCFMTQVGQTALSHGDPNPRRRVARWLLMIDDRVDGHRIGLLSAALAVVPGLSTDEVTATVLALGRDGFLRDTPAGLVLFDREGLRAVAGSSYGLPESEYRRILGPTGGHDPIRPRS